MILSIAEYREAQVRAARLRSHQPYCGPCFDTDGEINDLLPIKLWSGDRKPIQGHYCPCCGCEFGE